MAIIRDPTQLDSPINYFATLAFFCCVSCTVLMLKFKGFKASLDLLSWRKRDEENALTVSMTGAYRINRDEFFGNEKRYEPPKKLSPSMVKLPPSFDPEPTLRPTKSSGDLTKQANLPPQLQHHRSTHEISHDPRGGPSNNNRHTAPPAPPERKRRDAKNQDKEQRKLEKQRLAEQKAKEKAAAQEQARQEKKIREREKKTAQEQNKSAKKNKKKLPAPVKPQAANPLARLQEPHPAPPAATPAPSYSTNTLESSISRSSGPPPYSEAASVKPVDVQSKNSDPSNVSFGKPLDNTPDSWDLISQHRQQMSRPVISAPPRNRQKNMVMDLQYKLAPVVDNENSEA